MRGSLIGGFPPGLAWGRCQPASRRDHNKRGMVGEGGVIAAGHGQRQAVRCEPSAGPAAARRASALQTTPCRRQSCRPPRSSAPGRRGPASLSRSARLSSWVEPWRIKPTGCFTIASLFHPPGQLRPHARQLSRTPNCSRCPPITLSLETPAAEHLPGQLAPAFPFPTTLLAVRQES